LNTHGNVEADLILLYDSCAAKLQRYAMTLVRDHSLAQDAVQEAFLRYSLMRTAGRSIAAPRAWLFRVLRNYLLDVVKAGPAQNEVGMYELPDIRTGERIPSSYTHSGSCRGAFGTR
jgi:DNA-directed RNA polymerase specialized sigma24 family protein